MDHPFNLSDLQCLHVSWCEFKLSRPLGFYTGLLAHQRNSYLSPGLILPFLPPSHLDVEKSAFLISVDAVRKIMTWLLYVCLLVRMCVCV